MDPRTPGDQRPSEGEAAAARWAWPAALSRLAGGLVHEARNPLHAASLQVALLAEKLEGPAAAVAAPHLAALRTQVAKLDELLRDLSTLADAPDGRAADLAALARVAVRVHAPALRARRLGAEIRSGAGAAPVAGRPVGVAALVILLLGAALDEAADGAELLAEVAGRDGRIELRLSYQARPGATGGDGLAGAAALARELGGRLERLSAGPRVALALGLPGSGAA